MFAQPHVSAALRPLRGWITMLGVAIAVCAVGQMLVYGFANYTQIRFEEVSHAAPNGERKFEVLPPKEGVVDEAPSVAGGVRAQAIDRGRAVAPTRVNSRMDRVMGTFTGISTAVGTLACISIAVLTLLGVVIAGGAGVPGVEKTVTAGFWALVLGLLCMPWSSAFPGLKVPGVFSSYERLTSAADSLPGAISATAAFGQWIIMPLAASVLALFVCGFFRVGVERAILSVGNPMDSALQREMTDIAKRGVMTGSTRAHGALNRTVGPSKGSPSAAPMIPIPAASASAPQERPLASIEHAVDEAAAMAAQLVRETNGRGVADESYRRLI